MRRPSYTNRLRELRRLSGKTQAQVAGELGLNEKTLSTYETGRVEMGAGVIVLLADYYGVTCDEVLGRAHPNQPRYVSASDAELTYIQLFHRLAPNHRESVLDLMRGCVKGSARSM